SLPDGYVENNEDCDDEDNLINPDASELCDGIDNNCTDGLLDEALGQAEVCAAVSCQSILDLDNDAQDGLYWLDSDGDGDVSNAWEAYCDMTTDGGGWTKMESALWPFFFGNSDWTSYGFASDDNYSAFDRLYDFQVEGMYTFRYEVGGSISDVSSAQWLSAERSHFTVWMQDHHPAYETSDGSDYVYIDGEESTTCGGFNGLHSSYYDATGGSYAIVSDVDSTDSTGCWWHQVLPRSDYNSSGYLEGYDGPNYHAWHSFWVR
ncbi:MAG: hypothetical protein CMK59_05595, partial [Proteobacteria bacterium]|nr:hypothetical protein [Pseudomonadota bacterium]